MMGFHGYSISDIFDLYERHFGGAHHCFCSHSAMYYGIHRAGSSVSQAPFGAPGWIGSSATVRLCRHGPFQDPVSEDCPRRRCSELESGLSRTFNIGFFTAKNGVPQTWDFEGDLGRRRTGNGSGSGGLWIINIYEMTTPGVPRSTTLGRVALGCRPVSVADEG